MKASPLSRVIVIGMLALGCTAAFGKVISFNDLPGPVQREAQTELRNGPVKKIESVQENGRTIYALTFQRPDGSSKYIYLNADGTYVQNQNVPPISAPATGGTQVQMSQLPQAVQRTVQSELRNGPVSRIEQLSNNGQTMYQVFFTKSDGQQKVIYLNADGSYVQNNGSNSAVASSKATHSWDTLSSQQSNGLVSAKTVDFGSLPTPVQNVFRSQAGASGIQNIQQGQLNGQTVYQAAVNRNGRNLQVRVDSGGHVLSTMPLQSSLPNSQR
jgi:uncharacterized membrane protein YkoI